MAILFLQNANAQIKTNESQAKPWTRWWWMGSAVDETGIKKQLTQLATAGFGGVEIVPIYGAKGFEKNYINYLSPQWMKMLDYTVAQAKALNMGIYISVGTGWPIGGKDVTVADAASKLIVQKYILKANEKLVQKIIADEKQKSILSALMIYPKNSEPFDITNELQSDGTLNYITNKDAEVIAIYTAKTLQKVKRAAPGGEGYTIDHFSKEATANYFKIFDTAFGNLSHGVKAFFNDSYEVYNADWTPNFFAEFEKRRGYDLKKYFNFFSSNLENDTVARLKSDYRETISDLMLENFSTVFTSWTNKRNTKSVNQAHGSPGNLLDLYGAFDIPECETFGSSAFGVRGLRRDSTDIRNVDPDPIMLKFASSAAHAYGKKLTSSETFTWLGEHFKTSWSQCKPELDQVFLSGVNHVFYHGTTYTPAELKFPGWLFYAAVNFVPHNSMWKHLNGLNEYIARCQNVLQSGTPNENTIKMYWPVYDVWHNAKGLEMPLQVHSIDKWLHPTAFYKDVKWLQAKGFEVDFVSDKMIANTNIQQDLKNKIVIVPLCNKMPFATLEKLFALAKTGTNVIFEGLPLEPNGLTNLRDDNIKRRQIFAAAKLKNNYTADLQISNAGKGKIYVGNIQEALTKIKSNGEELTRFGLKYIKRNNENNRTSYFISNNTANDIDEKIQFNVAAKHFVFTNPLNGDSGFANNENTKVRIQLKSGQSIIVSTYGDENLDGLIWKYTEPLGTPIHLENSNWKLNFTEGGPYLPAEKTMSIIQPWTNFVDDSTTQSFSGTGVYTTTFNIKNKAADYLLQLDKLYESARIIINGKDAGLIWSLPFETKVGKYLKEGVNTISIEVCNLMANRIKNMDTNKELWRNYNEINFVNVNYKPFDASNWKVQPSGLDGSVILQPLK